VAHCGGSDALTSAAEIMASLSEISTQIEELAERGIPPAATVDPALHRQAAAYTIGRYRSLASCVKVLRWLDFAGCAAGLDLGCGAGHWCLGFAVLGGHATGIEKRPEFVSCAEHVVQALGFSDRIRFSAESIETAELPPASFDTAWSHSVLMYTDAEQAIERAARWLAPNGRFYIGYTTEGAYLDGIEDGLFGGNPQLFERECANLLEGYLHRAGVYHTVGRTRMLTLEQVRAICNAFGLSFLVEPGVQTNHGRYHGVHVTFDLLTQKTGDVNAIRQELMQDRAIHREWLVDLEELLQSDCPRLVCDALTSTHPDLVDDAHCDLYARALICAGRADNAEARQFFEENRRLPDRTLGLYWHDQGNFERALSCYRRLNRDHPDRAFLTGSCLLKLRQWDAARDEFRHAVAQSGGEIRDWIGLAGACFYAGDARAARDVFISLLNTRLALRSN
jgi:SAM-dependent methyltransferase